MSNPHYVLKFLGTSFVAVPIPIWNTLNIDSINYSFRIYSSFCSSQNASCSTFRKFLCEPCKRIHVEAWNISIKITVVKYYTNTDKISLYGNLVFRDIYMPKVIPQFKGDSGEKETKQMNSLNHTEYSLVEWVQWLRFLIGFLFHVVSYSPRANESLIGLHTKRTKHAKHWEQWQTAIQRFNRGSLNGKIKRQLGNYLQLYSAVLWVLLYLSFP